MKKTIKGILSFLIILFIIGVVGETVTRVSGLIGQAMGQVTARSPAPAHTAGPAVPSVLVDDGLTAEYPTDNISGSSTYTAAGLNSAERKIFSAMKKHYIELANGALTDAECKMNTTGLGITGADHQLQGVSLQAVEDALRMDCAYEMYWRNWSKGWKYEWRYAEGTHDVVSLTIKSEVHPEYAQSTPEGDKYYLYTTDLNKILPAAQALRNAQAVVEQYSGLSDYKKLAAYRDYICGQVEYNYDAYDAGQGQNTASRNPWQPIYVFDGDPRTNVVCEGYAKAFKYLCDLSEFTNYIDCLLVSGYTDSDHMWNLVRINGRSYMVDLTGCDSEWGRFGDLFLAGAEGATGDGFTIQCPRHNLSNGRYYKATTRSYQYKDITKQVYGGDLLTLAASKLDPANLS